MPSAFCLLEHWNVELSAPPWLHPRTAYVHVPFCAHHCGYCDFAVAAGRDHLIDLYLDAIGAELAALGAPRPVESLFVGGGTPTHLSADQLGRLLCSLNRWLPRVAPAPEFSVEANPDSLTEEKAAVLAAGGVNRVSIGVQSFHAGSLEALERRHSPDHIGKAVEGVRRSIGNVSFDLIFGAPGSTLATWKDDLETALGFGPQHVSTYGLTYEKGTPLWKRRHRGQVEAVAEEVELAMYEHAMDRLAAAGFEHYEISNFARPGFRCRHNERYWANEAYFGFGVGAARYVNGARELNVRDVQLYIRKALGGEPVTFQREELPPRERAFETAATQLRRADGIDRARFREQTGFDLDALAPKALRLLHEAGVIADDG
ncbi:MAG: radical SAM family heme chaperone HemW, partial [Gemmataceae bacterium]|nr:radical SAM family heme chaperone HemW [Gemmataceae bacterium]